MGVYAENIQLMKFDTLLNRRLVKNHLIQINYNLMP